MGMVGRKYTANASYRFGFNGKENDNEVKGEGNQQDYGMRIYDPRIGKFLSVDPLADEFSWYSPYHFAGGNPIRNIDIDGSEPLDYVKKWVHKTMIINDTRNSSTEVEWVRGIGVYSYEAVYDNITKQHWFVMQKPNDPQYFYWKHIDGADPNRLIQSRSGKLTNGEWVPFETQNQKQARIGKEVADGLATFWSVVIGGAFSGGGRFFHWVGMTFLEDAVGVPIINSPDDLAKYETRQLEKTASKQILGGTASSKILSQNLEISGVVRPSNAAAHHIVAGESGNIFAQQSRLILQKEGIDINEAVNGTFLPINSKFPSPPSSTHSTLHTNKYFENVFNRLNGAQPGKVRNELELISRELQQGTFEY